MDSTVKRAYFLELLGTFALVYFSAGVVCVNYMTAPSPLDPSSSAVQAQQPGLVGIALAQGLILAALLSVTVPLSGGYLNPAVTLMLWVFNRLDHVRTFWYIGAQLVGAALAGAALLYTFHEDVLASARLGTPHLNPLAFREITYGALAAGSAIEFVLTFFLVFAIFGASLDGDRQRLTGVPAGLTLTAGVFVAHALTGGAANPARWFGTVIWETTLPRAAGTPGPLADMFVYLAGPIVGALAAGVVYFKVMLPLRHPEADEAPAPHKPAEPTRHAGGAIRVKK